MVEEYIFAFQVELICKHDINVFINRQLIYNYPEQLFADKGVMAIEHADFDGIERLALVTGGEIVSTFGKPELVKVKEIITCLLSFGRCKVFQFHPLLDSSTIRTMYKFQTHSSPPILLRARKT